MGTDVVVYRGPGHVVHVEPDSEERRERSHKGRATDDEVKRRVFVVFRWVLEGEGPVEICQYAAVNWGVSQRQTYRYLASAYQLFDKNIEKKRGKLLVIQEAKHRHLWKIALGLIGQEGTKAVLAALAVLQSEAKIQRLYEGKGRVDHEIDPEVEELKRTVEELLSILERRREKARESGGTSSPPA